MNRIKSFMTKLVLILVVDLTITPLISSISINHGQSTFYYSTAPDFTLTDTEGNKFTLSDHFGMVIVIDFFVPTCGPCGSQIIELKEIYTHFNDTIIIISIDVNKNDKTQQLKDFRDQFAAEWIFALDTYDENVEQKYQITVLPTIVIINVSGDISFRHEGLVGADKLMDEITQAMRRTIYVDDDNTKGPWDGTQDNPYRFIQDGINQAKDGDTVFVYQGTYNESGILINHSITLIGENSERTVIDAHQEKDACYVCSDNVTISGFTFHNAFRAGINIASNTSHNVNISKNIFTHNAHGIHPYFPNKHLVISDNIFSDNTFGFTLVTCSHAQVYQNTFKNSTTGLMIFRSSYCDISYNNITDYKKYGIYLYGFSQFNFIHHNNFIKHSGSINAYFVHFSLHNKWERNYWNSPRTLPYPILGSLGLMIPSWINFDWHPAQNLNNVE